MIDFVSTRPDATEDVRSSGRLIAAVVASFIRDAATPPTTAEARGHANADTVRKVGLNKDALARVAKFDRKVAQANIEADLAFEAARKARMDADGAAGTDRADELEAAAAAAWDAYEAVNAVAVDFDSQVGYLEDDRPRHAIEYLFDDSSAASTHMQLVGGNLCTLREALLDTRPLGRSIYFTDAMRRVIQARHRWWRLSIQAQSASSHGVPA